MKMLILAIGGICLIPPFMVVLSYPLYKIDHKGNLIDYAKLCYKAKG